MTTEQNASYRDLFIIQPFGEKAAGDVLKLDALSTVQNWLDNTFADDIQTSTVRFIKVTLSLYWNPVGCQDPSVFEEIPASV